MDSTRERLTALVIIADYSFNDALVHFFKKNGTPLVLLTHGYGSAEPSIFDYLGFGGPKKTVAVSVQSRARAHLALAEIHRLLDLKKQGTGIAFTLSLSSVSSVLHDICRADSENAGIGSETMSTVSKEPYHLIVTIVNSGRSEQVMNAARAAGAGGGTVIHARGLGSKEAMKYLGITIQPEKDLVLIVAPSELRRPIMERIVKEAGLGTAGAGICFSLPVDSAMGINPPSSPAENA